MFLFEAILVRVFPHSDWIRRNTPHLSLSSSDTGKFGPEWLRIRTHLGSGDIFKQPYIQKILPHFTAITCHYLVNNTGERGIGERNDTLWCGDQGKRVSKTPFCKWHTVWMTRIKKSHKNLICFMVF